VDVELLKTVDRAQPLAGERISFTVSAVNRGPGSATNVAVFDTLRRSVFTSPSHVVSTGALVGDSLWTIPRLDSGQTATWTTAVTVASGVAGSSAANTALLRSLAENDTTPANDTARISLAFPLSAVPTVQITAPPDDAVFDPGDPVTFAATASDPEDGDLGPSIVWRSNVEGSLATGRSLTTSTLRAGVHTISASATDSDGGTGADTIRVTIALYTMPATLNVPFGGTASLPITLSQPAPTGGITLSVSSDNPSGTSPTSSTVFIPGGALSANARLSGHQPGTANVTVGNAQFGSAVVVASVTAELDILGGNVTFPSPFGATITVQLESQGTAIAAPLGGLGVALTARDPGCVSVPASITIPAGQVSRTAALSYGGSTATTCQTYVRATSPGIVADSVLVTVTPQPQITVGARTVGAGLQESSSGSLGAAGHGGVTLTLTSSDPSRLLVSPNATTAGSASIQLTIPDGTSGYSFYVQGVEGMTGTATVTVSGSGFVSGMATMTVVQPGIAIAGLGSSTTTLSADNPFYAYVGIPSGSAVSSQNLRAGASPLVVTFAVDNVNVGVLENSTTSDDTLTATIPSGLYYTPTSVAGGGVAFDPVGVGTATVTARAPGFIAQPNATQSVTVTAPQITVGARTVGAGLQESSSGSLGATGHGGVTLTLTSSDPSRLLVSPNATTAGSASIQLTIPDGTSGYSFYVQGVEGMTGTGTVTASAPGFLDGTATMTVVQPGIAIAGLATSMTAGAANDDFYAYVGIPSGNAVSSQNVRAGASSLTVTVTSSNGSAALLATPTASGTSVTAVIVSGLYYTPTTFAGGGFTLDPQAAGQTTVSASAPGFVTQPAGSVAVTITP
jgi:uncharacterized repeat protein (TIGR01451 family)